MARWFCLRRFPGALGRRLHQVVGRRTLDSVLIRIVIDHRMHSAEIIEWWRRRRRGPLERCRLPRIGRRWRALETAVNQVEEEDQLHSASEQRGVGDEFVHWQERNQEIVGEGGV